MKFCRTVVRLMPAALLLCCLTVQADASHSAYTLRTGSHDKYLDGTPSGAYQPSAALTRAQAASIVYGLMEQPPAVRYGGFADVPAGAWYEQAAEALAAAGILPPDDTGRFRPSEPITRAECAVMLSHFLPPPQAVLSFADLPADAPEAGAVSAAAGQGLLSADDAGNFRPADPVTRAEAAVIFNRLLGRAPNPSELMSTPEMRVFADVPVNHWAYADILEATTTHSYVPVTGSQFERWTDFQREEARIADGFHNIDGWLYFARDGRYVAAETVGNFTFDENGRWTTGNSALDETLAGIVRAQIKDDMSRDEKLRILYNYIRDNFTYIKRGLVSKEQTGWQSEYAASFFADGRGNCFSFAAAFQQLCRSIGVDAVTVVGNLGKNRQPHGWVEITLDGVAAVYDPEIEMVYRGRGRTYDMFRFQYSAAPFDYWK